MRSDATEVLSQRREHVRQVPGLLPGHFTTASGTRGAPLGDQAVAYSQSSGSKMRVLVLVSAGINRYIHVLASLKSCLRSRVVLLPITLKVMRLKSRFPGGAG